MQLCRIICTTFSLLRVHLYLYSAITSQGVDNYPRGNVQSVILLPSGMAFTCLILGGIHSVTFGYRGTSNWGLTSNRGPDQSSLRRFTASTRNFEAPSFSQPTTLMPLENPMGDMQALLPSQLFSIINLMSLSSISFHVSGEILSSKFDLKSN